MIESITFDPDKLRHGGLGKDFIAYQYALRDILHCLVDEKHISIPEAFNGDMTAFWHYLQTSKRAMQAVLDIAHGLVGDGLMSLEGTDLTALDVRAVGGPIGTILDRDNIKTERIGHCNQKARVGIHLLTAQIAKLEKEFLVWETRTQLGGYDCAHCEPLSNNSWLLKIEVNRPGIKHPLEAHIQDVEEKDLAAAFNGTSDPWHTPYDRWDMTEGLDGEGNKQKSNAIHKFKHRLELPRKSGQGNVLVTWTGHQINPSAEYVDPPTEWKGYQIQDTLTVE